MKRWLLPVITLVALLLVPLAGYAQGQGIEIPRGPAPTLDGDVSPGEWEGAVELPLEGLPLHTQALHDGQSAYLAFEVLTPAEEWETFAVQDNGDGEWYDAGDQMILCTADGCRRCDYSAEFDYTCADEDLPGAAGENLAEVQVPMDLLAGQVVFGAVLDGVEHVSEPFDVECVGVGLPAEEPGEAEQLEEEPAEAAGIEGFVASPWFPLLLALLVVLLVAGGWFIGRRAGAAKLEERCQDDAEAQKAKARALDEIQRIQRWFNDHVAEREAGLKSARAMGAKSAQWEEEVAEKKAAVKQLQDIYNAARQAADGCQLDSTLAGVTEAAKFLSGFKLLDDYVGAVTNRAKSSADKAKAGERDARNAAGKATRAGTVTDAKAAYDEANEASARAQQELENAQAEAQRAKYIVAWYGEEDDQQGQAAQSKADEAGRYAESALEAVKNANEHVVTAFNQWQQRR